MLTSPIQVECSAGINWNESAARVLAYGGRNGKFRRIRLGNSSLVKGPLCFPPCNRSAGWFELGVMKSIPSIGSKNCEQELAVAMPSKQPLIAIAKRSPIFEVRQLKCGLGWYVRILWPYGQEQYVNGFTSADAARSWIDRKSVGWLQSRAAALRVI